MGGRSISGLRCLVVSLLTFACAPTTPPEATGATAEPSASVPTVSSDRVALAMSAAPASIASAATIVDFDASGNMVELRAGSNGWLCFPDDTPTAVGNSPVCLDGAWQEWFDAYSKRETPVLSGIGMAYMLQGGPSASNTDPFATTPPAGETWHEMGPHLMIVVPDPATLDAFPADHMAAGPYVMYRGTPYAHLMVPVTQ